MPSISNDNNNNKCKTITQNAKITSKKEATKVLLNLPFELLEMVSEYLEFEDYFKLKATCQTFYHTLRRDYQCKTKGYPFIEWDFKRRELMKKFPSTFIPRKHLKLSILQPVSMRQLPDLVWKCHYEFKLQLNRFGQTFTKECIEKCLSKAISTNSVNSIFHLVSLTNVNVNIQDPQSKTALQVAVSFNNLPLISLLLSRNANVNHQPRTLLLPPPLLQSVSLNLLECTKLLLSHNANPNLKYSDGSNALMEATRLGNLDMVKVLIENGANVSFTRRGQTAFHVAFANKNKTLTSYLQSIAV